ncbi:MAG: hypothetical protein EZS28_014474 [Streblomastix strix]|uniref:Uncharacterized protein n=1 Tax=Streblomastix strix TaxID=222440 RepID=A0A5J4W6B0_9EUKA|nr:MAG: hypothetical protein EZS28_014474 [Streblomastix strix]
MKNIQYFEQILKIPVEGTEDQRKIILQKQESVCFLLSLTLENRNDDDLRRRIISSGIVEQFLFIFTTKKLDQITRAYTEAFFHLTNNTSNEIKLLIFSKKPFPGLQRLLDHTEYLIVSDAIATFINILYAGANSTPETGPNPHFETVKSCWGIEKIFDLFQKTTNQYQKNRATLCIGLIFRAREISDLTMRKEIINHLKTLITDTDTWVKSTAKYCLTGLSHNAVNKAEIETGGFVIPK